jgi:hypothetical protein
MDLLPYMRSGAFLLFSTEGSTPETIGPGSAEKVLAKWHRINIETCKIEMSMMQVQF